MTDNRFDLSRRKVLGSLGVVGTGAVLGGAGTAAYFNDEESSNRNTVQAGTLDLVMDWEYTANQDIKNTQTGSGGAGASFEISDVKPGDDGTITVNFTPESNPAWIWLKLKEQADRDEGQTTDPENETEDGLDGDGELDDEMMASIKNENGDVLYQETSLDGVLANYSGGALVDANPNTSEDDYFLAEHDGSVVLDWHIPSTVGNAMQGDVVKFDIVLYAEQARHNDNPQNPWD